MSRTEPNPTATPLPTQHQITRVMYNFDFEKVHKMMAAVDWQWHDGPVSVDRLKALARSLLNELRDKPTAVEIGTGGLVVGRAFVEHIGWFFYLHFRGESAGNDDLT